MRKNYYISFEDFKDILESGEIEVIRDTEIFLKYRYIKIYTPEGTELDKILSRRCAEARRPYLIKILYDDKRKNTVVYDFKGEDYNTNKRMFREMLYEKELYVFQKDYEKFKGSSALIRTYRVKGKSYYKVVLSAEAYMPELNFPYIYNDRYYNIEDEEDLEFLKDIYKQELEEV